VSAYRAADRVVWTIVALGALVGFAGIVGAVVIAERVSRPFHKLADKAGLIGRDSNELLPRVRGSFEAARLSTALRALVLRLSLAEKSTVEAQHQAADAARRLNSDIAKLRDLADADTLTELLNRRAFMEFGKQAMEESRRVGETFAILMIDIDNFKRVNDSFGHGAGDVVIRTVANTVARMLRPSDKGARFGGEEFVAMLPKVALAEAQEIAERLRARVAAMPVDMDGRELFMTISIGVAVCHAGDLSIQDLIERADVALYAAKRAGRNTVVLAPVEIARKQRSA
jgi:diguanylate cyclase (GGDEF)-like protein